MSTYLREMVLMHTLMGTYMVPPSAIYLALFTADPTKDDVGTEVVGGSYARQSLPFMMDGTDVGMNSDMVTFPTATAAWGQVAYWGLYDAVTAGNLHYFGSLDIPRMVLNTNSLTVPMGNIVVDLTGDPA
jgi:hypothetical protein